MALGMVQQPAGTSEEIAETLSKEGIGVKVANLKKDKVKGIPDYELVIVGNGIQMNKLTGDPVKFLKKFLKELMKKSFTFCLLRQRRTIKWRKRQR
jgi:menaquinone-dependent protoporphyrinogen IX oxidase